MNTDFAIGHDSASVMAGTSLIDLIAWKPIWKLEKWHQTSNHEAGLPPDEVIEFENNGLLNAGISEIWKLVSGRAQANPYSSGAAHLRVGNGTTAFSATHTDLQGASKFSKAMVSGAYPSLSAQQVQYQASFGNGEAEFAWEEVGIANGSGTPDGTFPILLNRKVQNLGTKGASSTWTLTLTITLS